MSRCSRDIERRLDRESIIRVRWLEIVLQMKWRKSKSRSMVLIPKVCKGEMSLRRQALELRSTTVKLSLSKDRRNSMIE